MKKITLTLGMMMIAGTMALPAFGAQQVQGQGAGNVVVAKNNVQPCCPDSYSQAEKTSPRGEDRTQVSKTPSFTTDPGYLELPWAALQY